MSNLLLAYGGLFLWSFLAATVLPLSSEAPLAVLVRAEGRIVAPVLIATAGNYLGACTTYWLGRRASQALGREPENSNKSEARAARLLRRFGQPVLLLSWVPIIGDALVALAGAMKLPFSAFSFWVVIGKGLRYVVVAMAVAAI